MEESAIEGTGDKPDNVATRLLERFRSPLLYIASQLPSTQSSHPQISDSLRARRQIAAEVEFLSGGRFALARDQTLGELTRYTRIKILHHQCQQYSWLSVAQVESLGGDKTCCCYCAEPLSLDHIGKESIKRFVELRSYGQVEFCDSNRLEDADITDIFLFRCINPCRGLEYDAPFFRFLDTPWSGCPCCQAKALS